MTACTTRPANSSAPPPRARPVSRSTGRCAWRATTGISNTRTARRSSGWRTPSGTARAWRDSRIGSFTPAYGRRKGSRWRNGRLAPGDDLKKQSAYSGFPERIAINPDFFKRLDAKLDVLSQAGILSAIAPLRELQSQTNAAAALPDDQAELLVRYVVARWGADPVAWLIAFEGDSAGKNVGRWKRIGQAVFGARPHAPVVLFPGEDAVAARRVPRSEVGGCVRLPKRDGRHRGRPQVDLCGAVGGGMEEGTGPAGDPLCALRKWSRCAQSGKRFSSDDVRHAVYWSLLLAPPAGVSYGGQGVANWDTTVGPKDEQTKAADLPMWRKALFMPAAKQMSSLAEVHDLDRLLETAPGTEGRRRATGRAVAAAVHRGGRHARPMTFRSFMCRRTARWNYY